MSEHAVFGNPLPDQVTAIRYLAWTEATRGGKVHYLDDTSHRAYIELCRKESLIPPRYNMDSTLTAKVTPEGPNQFTFELTSK